MQFYTQLQNALTLYVPLPPVRSPSSMPFLLYYMHQGKLINQLAKLYAKTKNTTTTHKAKQNNKC